MKWLSVGEKSEETCDNALPFKELFTILDRKECNFWRFSSNCMQYFFGTHSFARFKKLEDNSRCKPQRSVVCTHATYLSSFFSFAGFCKCPIIAKLSSVISVRLTNHASDVLQSSTIPSLSVKIYAAPGRPKKNLIRMSYVQVLIEIELILRHK